MIRRVLVILLALGGGAAQAADPQAGGVLYQEGRWQGQWLEGRIAGGPRLPGARLACAGCHGAEREGGGEGGVTAPALDAARLRRRGLLDPAALGRLLQEGQDPTGRTLSSAMPRFMLPAGALPDLQAYLRDPDPVDAPGVRADAIRLGLVLPPRLAALRHAAGRWADSLAAAGGLWGRRVEFVDLPSTPAPLAAALEASPVFLVLMPLLDPAASAVLATRQVPEVGPLVPVGHADEPARVWSIGPTLADQAAVLVDLLAERLPGPRAVPVLVSATAAGERLFTTVAARFAGHPGLQPLRRTHIEASELAAGGGALLLARPQALPALDAATLLAGPVDLLAEHAGAARTGRWLLSDPRPGTGSDTPLLERHGRIATRLVEAALERAGRRLTRRRFASAIAARPIGVEDGFTLDYTRFPGRGGVEVGLLDADPATGRLAHLGRRSPTTTDNGAAPRRD